MSAAKTPIQRGFCEGDFDFNGHKALNIDLSDIISSEFGLQTANRFFSGPSTGSPANPTFRAMVTADLPATTMLTTQNLAGLSNLTTSRTNLGLTAPATAASSTTGLQLLNVAAPSLEGFNFLMSADNVLNWATPGTALTRIGAEAALGNPGTNGFVLSSTTGGVRSWVSQTAAVLPVVDSTALVKGSSDATKLLKIEVDGLTTGTTRTLTAPNKNGTIATTDDVPYTAGILFGADEAGRSLSLTGNLAIFGEFTLDSFGFTTLLTSTGNTSVVLPLSGTLATLDGTEDLLNKTYNGITLGGTGGINLVDAIVNVTGTFSTEGSVSILGADGISLTATGATTLTLPLSGTLATLENAELLANKTLESSPSIGLRSNISGFDINLVNGDGLEVADRTLSLKVHAANRSIDLSGNLVLAHNLTTSGAFALTLTATATTSLTLPTTGTLVAWVSTPANSGSSGVAGQASYDSGGNLYICYATNTWGKVSLVNFP